MTGSSRRAMSQRPHSTDTFARRRSSRSPSRAGCASTPPDTTAPTGRSEHRTSCSQSRTTSGRVACHDSSHPVPSPPPHHTPPERELPSHDKPQTMTTRAGPSPHPPGNRLPDQRVCRLRLEPSPPITRRRHAPPCSLTCSRWPCMKSGLHMMTVLSWRTGEFPASRTRDSDSSFIQDGRTVRGLEDGSPKAGG